MQTMKKSRRKQVIWKMGAGLPLLALVLVALSSCVTPQGKRDGAPDIQASFAAKGPSVARPEEGREGFIIKERPQMDAASRKAFEQAVELLNRQDFGKAIDLLEPIVAQSPRVSAPYINLAMAYRSIGETEKAEAHLKTALTLVPDHPVACNVYGLLCRKNGRFAEAREYYEKAIVRFPAYYPAHRNLGILCDLYLNDPACALTHYELYSAARPEDQQVKLWIADLRNRLGSK
jgi:Tfp pilus assembly protein PilF